MSPLDQRLPEPIAFVRSSNRGRAFEARRAVADLLGRKGQVVRAGFDRDRAPRGCAPRAQSAARRPSRDARCARARRYRAPGESAARSPPYSASGGRLRATSRARRGSPVGRLQMPPATPRATSSGSSSRASDRHCRAKVALGDVREFIDSRGAQKALEAAHAGARERLELRGVAGHDAAPECHVDVTLPAAARRFSSSAATVVVGGHAVERHVDQRRDAAGRRGARRGCESFPVGAARLVDVHVRVDDARQHDESRRRRCTAVADDGTSPTCRTIATIRPSRDAHGRRAHAVGQHDAPAANDHGPRLLVAPRSGGAQRGFDAARKARRWRRRSRCDSRDRGARDRLADDACSA